MDELIPPPDNPISIRRSNFRATARQFTGLVVACYTMAFASAGAPTEPSYYIYHGKPKPLSLDPRCVAIHLRTAAEKPAPLAALPNSLTSRGFTADDVEAQPLPGWVVVNTRHVVAAGPRSQSVSPGAVDNPDSATAHAVVTSIITTPDPAIDFVSPVFRDTGGNAVAITSRLLIGFQKDCTAAQRASLLAAVPEGAVVESIRFSQPN